MERSFCETIDPAGSGMPYIVAELNTSHFGRIELAKEAIVRAAQSGADCVKFQSWKPESLYTSEYLKKHRIEGRLYERFSLSADVIRELSDFAESNSISFASTPYSNSEIRTLSEINNVPFIKIASMDLTNQDLIACAVQTGKPLILSTGMANEVEIKDAVKSARAASSLCLLHCVSLYPTPLHLANIRAIPWLMETFPNCRVGYSDHTIGSDAAIMATALGAKVIEKHVSIDKSRPGFDNEMAMSFGEFEDFVSKIRMAAIMLGPQNKVVSFEEQAQSVKLRRSAHASRDIDANEPLSREMVEFKRPGGGIDVNTIDKWIGVKLVRSIRKGIQIGESDFGDEIQMTKGIVKNNGH